ncbi:hypothetical protein M406DRAFT_103049 [Cryphonectria parasitica EP155]|uniref:Uncharacterized protein n=1 Tax=Cryphonectria parasitica (strain ATCC 38755 / EP155) TaxID=660469 RepID=A0A9P4XWK9_CRYP1|nr:uncharacterized protein M406DRAFT_103049 [Cryphonectria parasitica EP155]KAF3762147.1 hypothetical protein M406DRAFT_103049 [Cryphonectria parasitica EP155]
MYHASLCPGLFRWVTGWILTRREFEAANFQKKTENNNNKCTDFRPIRIRDRGICA